MRDLPGARVQRLRPPEALRSRESSAAQQQAPRSRAWWVQLGWSCGSMRQGEGEGGDEEAHRQAAAVPHKPPSPPQRIQKGTCATVSSAATAPTCSRRSSSRPLRTSPATTRPAPSAAAPPAAPAAAPAAAELSAVSASSRLLPFPPPLLSTEAEGASASVASDCAAAAEAASSRCRLFALLPLRPPPATCAAAHSMAPRCGGRPSVSTTTAAQHSTAQHSTAQHGATHRENNSRTAGPRAWQQQQQRLRPCRLSCACAPVLLVHARFISLCPCTARTRTLHHPSATSSTLQPGAGPSRGASRRR